MSLKRLFTLLALCLALALPGLALAQSARPFAVLPFKVSSDKFQYLSKGAQAPVSNRLTWLGYFEPISNDKIAGVGNKIPTGPAEAQSMSRMMRGAPYSAMAPTAPATRSAPISEGSSSLMLRPVLMPAPTTTGLSPVRHFTADSMEAVTCGTTEDTMAPSKDL